MNQKFATTRRAVLKGSALGAMLVGGSIPASGDRASGVDAASTAWPMVRRGPAATSATPAAGPRENPATKWSTSGLGAEMQEVAAGTTAYTSQFALDSTDGTGIWNESFGAPPVVDGTSLYTTQGRAVVGLNRRDASVQWRFGGDGGARESGPRATQSFSEPGDYEVRLTVTDEGGLSETTTDTVTVRPEPTETQTETTGADDEDTGSETETEDESTDATAATATDGANGESETSGVSASFPHSPTDPPVGETVSFDASGSSTTADEILAYEWDFDDGLSGAGKEVQHEFDVVGHFLVELTVTDSAGNTDRTEREVRTVRGGDGAGETPGLGVTSALAGLGGVGYLLRRRLGDDD